PLAPPAAAETRGRGGGGGAGGGGWPGGGAGAGGRFPAANVRVLIRDGHTVVYDVNSDQALRSVHVAGVLRFATDKNTRLDVGLLKIQANEECMEEGFDCDARPHPIDEKRPRPALEVGMPDQPISAKHTARIRLVSLAGMNKDSLPAPAWRGGRMDLHGAPLSQAWVKLGATAKSGDDKVTLAEAVTGWRAGDRVVVTATAHKYRTESQSEERLIKAIDG